MDHEFLDCGEGDILIHCGDFTNEGNRAETLFFLDWFLAQEYKHKVLVAGNHEVFLAKNPDFPKSLGDKSLFFLNDQFVEINGLKIYGSPCSLKFGETHNAFQFDEEELPAKLDGCPSDVDIFITHSPPLWWLDKGKGSRSILEKINQFNTQPKSRLFCFGHIHQAYGVKEHGDSFYVNASQAGLSEEGYPPSPVHFIYRQGRFYATK